MMQTVTLLLCIAGLFVHYHKSQNRIQTRCDVSLHGRKYDGPTTKSILFIYVRTHRVTFCEKASFRQLALVLLSGDVALNPGPLKFGFANCRSIRNKGPILCDEIQTGNFDVFGLTETHIKALDTPSFLCQLTCQSADIMSSLCGVGVRVHVNNFFSKTTRPRDMLFFLKDTLSIEDEKLFKACKSVCSSVCYRHYKGVPPPKV